jgi:hypothetical protein
MTVDSARSAAFEYSGRPLVYYVIAMNQKYTEGELANLVVASWVQCDYGYQKTESVHGLGL